MKRFILTGTPGAGKTTILRQLEIEGFDVVEEAATNVIALEQAKGVAEPWLQGGFLDMVVDLQRPRLLEVAAIRRAV
jgi:predicted ATPase